MMFRLRYCGVHFFLSVCVAILLLSLVFLVWYPAPLEKALGVADIFLLIIGIDVVLGPLLTLIVAKQGKKTLKFDLLVVVVVQFAALLYGLHVVSQGRPVWIIYNSGKFELVQAYEVIGGDTENVLPAFVELSYGGPIWGGVSPARYSDEGELLPFQDMYLRAEYLSAYQDVSEDLVRRSVPLKVLYSFNEPDLVDLMLKKYPSADAFLPLQAKERPLVVLINKTTSDPVAIVNLAPW